MMNICLEADSWVGVDLEVNRWAPPVMIRTNKCAERANVVVACLVNICEGSNISFWRKEGLPRSLGRILALEGVPHFIFGPEAKLKGVSFEEVPEIISRADQKEKKQTGKGVLKPIHERDFQVHTNATGSLRASVSGTKVIDEGLEKEKVADKAPKMEKQSRTQTVCENVKVTNEKESIKETAQDAKERAKAAENVQTHEPMSSNEKRNFEGGKGGFKEGFVGEKEKTMGGRGFRGRGGREGFRGGRGGRGRNNPYESEGYETEKEGKRQENVDDADQEWDPGDDERDEGEVRGSEDSDDDFLASVEESEEEEEHVRVSEMQKEAERKLMGVNATPTKLTKAQKKKLRKKKGSGGGKAKASGCGLDIVRQWADDGGGAAHSSEAVAALLCNGRIRQGCYLWWLVDHINEQPKARMAIYLSSTAGLFLFCRFNCHEVDDGCL
nr:FACT complex subunit SPT16-like [Ipomoea batatas]